VLAVPTLAAEPPRKKRPAIGELIEQASGPISVAQPSLPDLDEDIDVAAVMARARVLAGSGDIDAELDALRDASSAPIEITVEAASAALAKQFGLWAPPPQVKEPAVPEPMAETVPANAEAVPSEDAAAVPEPIADAAPAGAVETVPSGAAAAGAVETVPSEAAPVAVPEPIDAEAAPEPAVHVAPEPADTVADLNAAAAAALEVVAQRASVAEADEYEARERARDEAFRRRHLSDGGDIAEIRDTPPPDDDAHEVEPEQIHDEIHALGENDFEEVEHTAIGANDTLGFEGQAMATRVTDASSFAEDHAMADRLDAELAAAEAEAEHDDLGIGEASAVHRMAYAPEPVAEALAPTEYAHGYVQPAEPEYEPQQADAPYDGFEGDGTLGLGAQTYAGTGDEYEEIEEIEDFEILAEADAEDADLLAGHGFVPPPQQAYPPPPADMLDDEPVARPSQSDFALRLDLGDDSGAGYYPNAVPEQQDDALARSAGHALAAFDDPPAGAYPPLHGFDDSDVIDISNERPRRATSTPATPTPITPAPRFRAKAPPGIAPVAAPSPAADIDLESALEALDVDLDDLAVRGSGPQPAHGRARRHDDSRQPTPAPVSGKTRARTDDGILIDFDDDDR
jgi:hypothetical protein